MNTPIFSVEHVHYPNVYPLHVLSQSHAIDTDPQADDANFYLEADEEEELIHLRPSTGLSTVIWFLCVKRIQTRPAFGLSEFRLHPLLAPQNKWFKCEDNRPVAIYSFALHDLNHPFWMNQVVCCK